MSDLSGVPPEPVLGEPPVLAHDPASTEARDTSVRVVGGAAPAAVTATTSTMEGPVGPVPGLAPEQAAPVPASVPKAPRRRRRRGRWFAVAGVLAVAGAGLVAGAALSDEGTPTATGAAPSARLATPVLSARRVPELVARPVALRNVAAAVGPVVGRFPDASCVLVTDGATSLAASGDTNPLIPASNIKLVTGSAALSTLGADTRLTTKVVAPAAPTGGTVAGDLFLVGGGDPLLSTSTAARRWKHGPQPTSSLEALADDVVAAGVRRVDGAVVGDGTRFDDQRTVPSWAAADVASGEVANIGALMVNDAWTLDPIDPAGAAGGPAADPAAHAADVFTQLLEARGVEVVGPARSGAAPAGAAPVAELQSPTIREIVAEMDTFSDNTTAEVLVKEMGAAKDGAGSTKAGIQVLVADLATRGLPIEGLVMEDGSGLSRSNRVTCRLLDAVLAADGPTGALTSGLARPGQPGTLDDRFLRPPLRDRVAAKTGTLSGITGLSGWVTTDSGRPLAFSTVQNPAGRAVQAADLALQGQLLEALLTYPQAPPVEQLRPLPPAAA
ncbi:D-alanyl-D-alanine carboxypeptidase/D-alanyl-D-alanine endopeptidase [Dermatobacter hominis]|uniref:D-alanyl-D-alanine carboxypeptidase/D-alanyl-D-alanine endopeptidase n=1 Tax=Dermatobacter hominis TaxID=2884263 RepID=UPI001D0FA043|nr:D-alanyl-D-alanine carboxypeptidase/D-alanyl-D-alanine-endopeptidase [Dermatobacter hominis]UDY36408.1 D-alanyl-D-alanine carboxypeptidase/D-alanyl-D-alanine-endopeptidase [Dermatobacter hominis]